ncbi:MAG: hypothetical protein M1818_005343 [Claussenomyces sp. TS43310]|nr:MAG: hypothetical protein M1818_005343 [Claussenomyces sp. TS43310]
MGLPLFKAPAEPEVATQSSTDKTNARARSTIRRQRTIRGLNARSRAEAWRDAPSPTEPSTLPPERLLPLDQAVADVVERFHGDERPASRSDAFRGIPRPRGEIPLSSLPRLERQSSLQVVDPQAFPHLSENRRAILLRLYATRASLRRLPQDPQLSLNPSATAPSPPPENSLAPRSFQGISPRATRPLSGAYSPWTNDDHALSNEELPPLRRFGPSTAYMAQQRRDPHLNTTRLDGLGDRIRSPSWEGDGTWDTLLTTLTPDPQPPTAASSFASTSVSTSTTMNPETSGTPLTSFDDDLTLENACDIVEDIVGLFSDGSDTEAEMEDEIYESNDRSYADVVSSRRRRLARRNGGTDIPESLGGMQRIIRRLAGREDIPDEWWAEVGLSRSLRREEIV